MFRFLLPFFTFTTVDAGGGGGEAPPVAPAPDAVPAPEAPAAAPAVDILGSDPETLLPDDAPYRDAKVVREALTKARQEYGPIADTIGGLPAPQRDAALAVLPGRGLLAYEPGLGSDLGFIEATFPTLVEADQEVIRGGMARAKDNPAATIEWVKEIVGMLRAPDEPEAPAEPEFDALGYDKDDPDRPMTRKDLDAYYAEQQKTQDDNRRAQTIRDDMARLGYDPQATDPVEYAKAAALLSQLSKVPNGTVEQAHEATAQAWEAYDQRIIDEYVSGARRTAARSLTPEGGAPPSNERKLDTLEAMDAAAAERIAAMQERNRSSR